METLKPLYSMTGSPWGESAVLARNGEWIAYRVSLERAQCIYDKDPDAHTLATVKVVGGDFEIIDTKETPSGSAQAA